MFFFECPSARMVWDKSELRNVVDSAPVGNADMKVRWWANKAGVKEVRSILATAWAIWFLRNKYVHEKKYLNADVTTSGFLQLVEEYGWYTTNVSSVHPAIGAPLSATRWHPPPTGTMKVNVDAHVVEGAYVGLCVLVRNHEGRLIVTATKRLNVAWKADMAEVWSSSGTKDGF